MEAIKKISCQFFREHLEKKSLKMPFAFFYLFLFDDKSEKLFCSVLHLSGLKLSKISCQFLSFLWTSFGQEVFIHLEFFLYCEHFSEVLLF